MFTKEQIVDAARELFARDGFTATSVRDIADAVGSSKATVLYHFPSKDLLLEATLQDALTGAAGLLHTLTDTTHFSGQDRLEEFITRLVDLLIEHRHALHIVITHVHLAPEVSIIARAQELMAQLSTAMTGPGERNRESFRLELALSGATFSLVAGSLFNLTPMPEEQLRPLLLETVLDIIGHSTSRPEGVGR